MSKDILNDIINDFSPEKFVKFFRSKNTSFSPRQSELAQYNDDNFKNGKKLGDISFKDNALIIYTFQAVQALSEKTGKKAQYEKGKKILKENQIDAGIFIYYDLTGNFRFSLIYANYLGSRRDWSTFRRFTYFVNRKFTNKTFLQRIGDEDFSSLEKIKDAFSVDKVTKSFYTDIANWYFWAVQNVSFPKDAEDEENGRNTAVIRLITRLIFIWFMKERGLVQGVLFEQSQVAQLLKDLSAEKTTYYKAILQNLFFSTLNTKIDNRKYRFQESFQGKNVDYMDHSIYRYESYFKDNETMLSVFKDIPYLNGGLFDCLDKPSKDNENQGEVRIDGFTDKDVGLNIPNYLFFSELEEADLNNDYGTKNKKYKVRGIINILSSYNFTIDENDPNDQEVALDPELLGKVFENLLASFNPETASTARKATGSYYTPREIVDYMVTQSLKNYLITNLAESDELDNKIEQLFSNSDDTNPFTHEQTLRIVNLIDNLRVVDPAVGSGAFPMGILNKLVFALAKLDPNNTIWKETQLKAVELNVTDPVLSKKLRDQVEEQFTQKNFDYGRKLYLIQKCIYGVDIQQIAVEIAKLRFFISLLVDEKVDKTKENWGIEPLPNLDYKIMQGNSLVEEYEGVKLFDERLLNVELPNKEETNEVIQRIKYIQKDLMPYYQKSPQWLKNPKLERPSELTILESELNRLKAVQKDLEKLNRSGTKTNNQQLLLQSDEVKSQMVWMELQKLHKQLFSPSLARNEKNDLRQKIDELEWKLIEETLREQGKIKELEKIKKLENSNTKPFFLWELYFPEVFQEKKGFDVVIANPPYLRVQELPETDKANYKRLYKSAVGSYDLYILFIERGFNLLNPNGILNYITPDKWINGDLGKGLRKLVASYINKLISFKHYQIFNASTYSSLLWLKKLPQTQTFYTELEKDLPNNQDLQNWLQGLNDSHFSVIPNKAIGEEAWIFTRNKSFSIMQKLISQPRKAIDIFENIFQGIATSKDSVYFLYRCKKEGNFINGYSEALGRNTLLEKDLLKPLLMGDDVHRYQNLNTHKMVIFPYKIEVDGKTNKAVTIQPEEIKNHFPKTWQYFLDCENIIKNRENGKLKNAKDWYKYIYPKNLMLFNQPKLVCPYISIKSQFTLDENGEFYTNTKVYGFIKKQQVQDNYKYLLALLNSTLTWFYITNVSAVFRGGYYTYSPMYIENFPIPTATPKTQATFIEIVDKIQDLTKSGDYSLNATKQNEVKEQQNKIDQLVYKLYDLTPGEIAVVEGKND